MKRDIQYLCRKSCVTRFFNGVLCSTCQAQQPLPTAFGAFGKKIEPLDGVTT